MSISKNIYKKLTILSKNLLQSKQIPLYRTKFSKKEFTTYQLLTLLIIKTYENKGYRKFIEFLEASKIPEWLHLKKIPHFTTLQKFAKRLDINFLENLLLASSKVTKKSSHIGVDATGLSFRNPSKHYEQRIGLKIKKKDFLKCCFMADLDNQLIHAVKLRKRARHDTKDFIPLWNKIKHLPFIWVYFDKGYDADYIHQAIYDEGKISFGDLKNIDVPIHRTKGVARKKAKRYRKYLKKRWRSLIETINGVIKGMFGSNVNAKNLHNQKVEVILKLICYNLYRISSRNLNFYVTLIAHFIGQLFLYKRENLKFSHYL
jgi:hypothetical protein